MAIGNYFFWKQGSDPRDCVLAVLSCRGNDRQGQERVACIWELLTPAQGLGSGLSTHFPHISLLTSWNAVKTQKESLGNQAHGNSNFW